MENATTQQENKKRSKFSGRLGYVLAVAGSAVGLGNIWRFPYLAAKYGGGMFLFTYLVLMLTFGYALIVSETALGRMTGKSPVGAFQAFGKTFFFRFGGWVNAVIPMLIVPYYCAIGGWVMKYLGEYLRGSTEALAKDNYFSDYTASAGGMEGWFLVFAFLVLLVILGGVKKGIERISKVMMPMLVVLAVVVAIYSMTRPGAMAGIKYFLIPDFSHFSWMSVVAAMGQMFYSLSIAMGILYTYGSYLKKDVDIEVSTSQVELFDTGIAVLAGLMIIPAIFAFGNGDPSLLQAGPSLMFITIPKVFASMGLGRAVGILFFLLVFLAALTSAVSLMETSVSTFSDQLGWSRKSCIFLMGILTLLLGSLSVLGFNVLGFVKIFGMSILSFFDFLTNSLMMPIAALATCILIQKVVGQKNMDEEVMISSKFRRRKLYHFVMRYLAPIFLIVILFSSIANVLGWVQI